MEKIPNSKNILTFINTGNSVIINNQEELDILVSLLKIYGITLEQDKYNDWIFLARLNNHPTDYIIFEYENYKGFTFGNTKEESVKWFEMEPFEITDLYTNADKDNIFFSKFKNIEDKLSEVFVDFEYPGAYENLTVFINKGQAYFNGEYCKIDDVVNSIAKRVGNSIESNNYLEGNFIIDRTYGELSQIEDQKEDNLRLKMGIINFLLSLKVCGTESIKEENKEKYYYLAYVGDIDLYDYTIFDTENELDIFIKKIFKEYGYKESEVK